MKPALVLEVKGNSLDDGPGIRSVVFFKGCPLSCVWCHNPEGISPDLEISYDGTACVGCDSCIDVCPEQALSRDNPYFINRATCRLCLTCADQCPSGALRGVGEAIAVEQVVDIVKRDKLFFDNSGGGVTLSGGEPTRDMVYTGALLKELMQQGIHTLLETCGLFGLKRFDELIYPYVDEIYFDLKLINEQAHIQYCGASNAVILENFRVLNARFADGGIKITPRTPLIPGITDSDDNIRGIVAFLKSCGVSQARLLPYHPLWQEKKRQLGQDNTDSDVLKRFAGRQRMTECRSIFEAAGIAV